MERNTPFVSVVIVAYQAEKTLQRTLDALAEQTYRDFEIVFVNNGATDSTGELFSAFMEQHPELQYRLEKVEINQGLQPGRMAGLAAVSGEYVLFNDADDWMAPDCLELLTAEAKKPGIDKVMGAFTEINEQGEVLRTVNFVDNQCLWLVVNLQAVLFRRDIIQDHGLVFHPGYLDDIDFNSFYNEFSTGAAYIRKPIYYYYVNQNSTSGAKNKNRPWTGVTMVRDTIDLLKPLHDRLPLEEDRLALQYLIIKQYYFYLLHNYRYSSFKEIVAAFSEAKGLLRKSFPAHLTVPSKEYIHNVGDRPSGKKLVNLLRTAERMHLLKPLLFGYSLLSKVTYVHS
ncbi:MULTISPECIES: glycosyltransferase family 2 protein [unclassified Oscillibacter]|uniref:glycosyltransferase family 2 protein n=1 Tax=unclassified Oscillibacter TaxID=2629304 RepID=UPI0025D4B420|nr:MULTISPECIES: glycosyltransferase family 2 protein [unclassified Oscillibacter]